MFPDGTVMKKIKTQPGQLSINKATKVLENKFCNMANLPNIFCRKNNQEKKRKEEEKKKKKKKKRREKEMPYFDVGS